MGEYGSCSNGTKLFFVWNSSLFHMTERNLGGQRPYWRLISLKARRRCIICYASTSSVPWAEGYWNPAQPTWKAVSEVAASCVPGIYRGLLIVLQWIETALSFYGPLLRGSRCHLVKPCISKFQWEGEQRATEKENQLSEFLRQKNAKNAFPDLAARWMLAHWSHPKFVSPARSTLLRPVCRKAELVYICFAYISRYFCGGKEGTSNGGDD